MIFPANDDATIVMQPSEQALHLPATAIASEDAAILRGLSAARWIVRSDQFDAEALTDFRVERIAVVSAVTDHSLGHFGEEAPLQGGADEFRFMRRSAGHVHGERKAMAVADRHDFAALTASPRSRLPEMRGGNHFIPYNRFRCFLTGFPATLVTYVMLSSRSIAFLLSLTLVCPIACSFPTCLRYQASSCFLPQVSQFVAKSRAK